MGEKIVKVKFDERQALRQLQQYTEHYGSHGSTFLKSWFSIPPRSKGLRQTIHMKKLIAFFPVHLLAFHLSGVVYCITRPANVAQLYAIVTKQRYIFRGWGVGKKLCAPRSTSSSFAITKGQPIRKCGVGNFRAAGIFVFVIKFLVWLFLCHSINVFKG